jgi:hypothetical protein
MDNTRKEIWMSDTCQDIISSVPVSTLWNLRISSTEPVVEKEVFLSV